MKIDINTLRQVPLFLKKDGGEFSLSYSGVIPENIREWINFHSLKESVIENPQVNYTNIQIPNGADLKSMFKVREPFPYMDGFSPNLNKKLHIGHFTNFVLAKAFYNMAVCEVSVSIYGNTLAGEISQLEAFNLLKKYFSQFQYRAQEEFFAVDMQYEGDKLVPGIGKYEGTKVFEVGEEKVVGIKSDGSTSYFYQDVCLAEIILKKCQDKNKQPGMLYLTGQEQENHFRLLQFIYPHITHIPLGLLKVSGKKMGTRFGNVIYIDDFINEMNEAMEVELNDESIKLIYNIFAGSILSSSPESSKNINMDELNNPKNSLGLYISYTMARLYSAGLEMKHEDKFDSIELDYLHLKAKNNLKPNMLFEGLVKLCNDINSLYKTHIIKDNEENKKMFSTLLSDLLLGCEKLGLFSIKKV